MPTFVEVGVQTIKLQRTGTKVPRQVGQQHQSLESKDSISISKTNTNEDAIAESDKESEIMMDPDTESDEADKRDNTSSHADKSNVGGDPSSRIEPSSRISKNLSTQRSKPPTTVTRGKSADMT